MGKIAVITDSNTCLPADITQVYQIAIVPILLIFDDKTLRDGVDITTQEFYARLQDADPLPKTSTPSPAHYIECFEGAIRNGAEGIVVVTLSSKLSVSYNSAHLAAERFEDIPVHVVDGRMATIAQGFLALTAAEAAKKGLDIDAVAAAAEDSIPGTGFAIMLDTLEYLHRGGRVPAIASLLGSAVGLNPVLGNRRDGTVGVIAPCLGKDAALKRIILEVERKSSGRKIRRLAVTHASAPEDAGDLKNIVDERFGCEETYLVELTPVMGAHAGPGVVGLAYQIADAEAPEDN